jgi:hypothetical protein
MIRQACVATTAAVLCGVILASSVQAQSLRDTLTIGTVTAPFGTGVVLVPLYLRDVAGTPLGLDRAPGSRITGVAVKVSYGNAQCVTASNMLSEPPNGVLGTLMATAACGTILEHKARVAGVSQSYVFNAPEQSGPDPCGVIPLTLGAASPGDHLVDLELTLAGCSSGTIIPLTITVTGGANAVVNSDGGVRESSASGSLDLVNGQVTVAYPRIKGADSPGIYRADDRNWYLKYVNVGGFADLVFPYGDPSDQAVKGDWDGDGDDTVGILRGGTFHLRNWNTAGSGEITFPFGAPGDIPVAGDWDGDGIDTIGVYRPSEAAWFLRNTNAAGAPDISFTYGLANETPVVGDWDGDGIDTVGIFRASDRQWYLHNSNAGGNAELVFPYGDPAQDVPVVGDWDGDGDDTVGIYRAALGEWFLKNTNEAGFADLNFTYGLVNEKPLAGDWDGQ